MAPERPPDPTPDALNAANELLRELLVVMGLPAWQANHKGIVRLCSMLVAERQAERERCAGLFAGAAGRVKVRNASGERIDLISPELGDEIAAAIRQSPSS
jgi:hypothetical protein